MMPLKKVEVSSLRPAEQFLLPLQKKQAEHDERAHRDILALDTHTRIKHMVLHFLKYLGKFIDARNAKSADQFERALLDTFVICLATGNALNVSLGEKLNEAADLTSLMEALAKDIGEPDVYLAAVLLLTPIAGQMAKAVESADHWEKGDHRGSMENVLVEFTKRVLGLLGRTSLAANIPAALQERWDGVESKSIFRRLNQGPAL